MENQQSKNRYALIDIFKFFAAFLVAAIHLEPFTSLDVRFDWLFTNYICRIAVPFFFMAAGFFCFRKTSADNFNIKISNKYAIRVFILYTVWFIIYYIPRFDPQSFSVLSFLTGYLAKGYYHLWYLKSTAFAVFITGLLLKSKANTKVILGLSSFFYVSGLLFQVGYGSFFNSGSDLEPYHTRNGLFFGFLFIVLGMLLAYEKIKIKTKISVILMLVSAALWGAEVVLCLKLHLASSDQKIFLVPTVFFMFNILLNIRSTVSFDTGILRRLSTFIYFLHPFVNFYILPALLNLICDITKSDIVLNSVANYILVLIIAVAISGAVIKLQSLKGFKWLKFLS